MDSTSQPTGTGSGKGPIVLIVAIVALLFGCCFCLLVGGAATFLLARQSSGDVIGESRLFELPAVPELPAIPERPAVPELPDLPQLPEALGGSGAFVREVMAGSPAEAADLRAGDLIVQVENVPVDSNHRLANIISRYSPGDRVTLQIVRNGRESSLEVMLGATEEGLPYLGIRYFDMFPEGTPGD